MTVKETLGALRSCSLASRWMGALDTAALSFEVASTVFQWLVSCLFMVGSDPLGEGMRSRAGPHEKEQQSQRRAVCPNDHVCNHATSPQPAIIEVRTQQIESS